MTKNLDFLTNFDSFSSSSSEKDPSLIPLFSEVDMTTAREISFSQGVEKGKQEALSDIKTKTYESIQGFQTLFNDFMNHQNQENHRIFEEAVAISSFIAHKHALSIAEQHAADRCLAFVQKTLENLLEKRTVILKAHPHIVGALKKEMKDPLLTVEEDSTLALQDCHLTWADGGALLSMQKTKEALNDLIQSYGVSQRPKENTDE